MGVGMNKSLSQNVLPVAPLRTFEALVTVQHHEVRQIEVFVPGYSDCDIARILNGGRYDDFVVFGPEAGTAYVDGKPVARITGYDGPVAFINPLEEDLEYCNPGDMLIELS